MVAPAFDRRSAVKAVLMTTASTYLTYAIGLLVSVMVTRALGADEFGRYAYLVWLVGTLVTIANNGLTMAAIKFVAEASSQHEPERAHAITRHLRRIQYATIAVVALAVVLGLPWLKPAGWEGSSGLLATLCLIAFSFKATSMLTTSIAKGYRNFHVEAITNATAVTIGALLAVAALYWAKTLLGFATVFAFTSVVYAIASALLTRGQAPSAPAPALSVEIRARIHRYVLSTATLIAISILGAQSLSMFLLNRWSGAKEVGFLSIAYALTRAGLELLVAGLSATTMPIIGHTLASGDLARTQRVLDDTARYYQFLGLMVAGVGFYWAYPLITLAYGPAFANVGLIFRISVLTSGVLLSSAAFQAVIANSDHNRFRLITIGSSALLSLAIAILLIPSHGAVGAAIAGAVPTLTVPIATMIGVHRFMGLSTPVRALGKQYLLFALSGALAWLLQAALGTRAFAPWSAGVAFAACFLGSSLWVGIWRRDERALAAGYLRRVRPLRGLADLIER